MTNLLKQSIQLATQSWPNLSSLGDPNTIDVYWLASHVRGYLGVPLPTKVLDKSTGVAIVECIESRFIRGSLIRKRTRQQLVADSEKLTWAINKLLPFGPEECLVAGLYTWHGCICMAKLVRPTSVAPWTSTGEAPYTHNERMDGYRSLERQWLDEDVNGNLWIKYGVSLALLLKLNRNEIPVDDWVPRDSPYWT